MPYYRTENYIDTAIENKQKHFNDLVTNLEPNSFISKTYSGKDNESSVTHSEGDYYAPYIASEKDLDQLINKTIAEYNDNLKNINNAIKNARSLASSYGTQKWKTRQVEYFYNE